MMRNAIYLVVTQTGTMVSRIIKLFTDKPYNHSSLSSNKNLSDMYSFCRTYTHFPIPAAFNRELIGKGVLGKFTCIPCEIYEIPVTSEQKKEYHALIKHFNANRKNYTYNYIGLCFIFFKINRKNNNKFLCSQFAGHILNQIGVKLPKPVSLCTPDDLRRIEDSSLIYKGDLLQYYSRINQSVFVSDSV